MGVIMNTRTRTLAHSGLLLLTALIWGVAFVAQTTGGDMVGAFTFTSVRFLIAATVFAVVVLIRMKRVQGRNLRVLFTGGAVCGILLSLATNLQQLGLNYGTSAGKAGFITTTYIVLVPVVAFFFLKRRSGWNVWVGVVIALVSLYLMCINESLSFRMSDLLVLACAVAFTAQILCIDHFAPRTDPIELSCIQFAVCGLLSAIPMCAVEIAPNAASWAAALSMWDPWIPLLYAAVLSGGLGYTLQTIGQKGVSPTIASLMMSFESVFAVLAGWVILHQALSARELIGCGLMLVAVVMAQLPNRHAAQKEHAIEPPDLEK